MFDAKSGENLRTFRPKQQDEGSSISFSPDGSFIVDGSWSGEIRVRSISDLSAFKCSAFPGEMISAVSPSERGELWLFGHTTKTLAEPATTARPYLTLWRWPLSEPMRRIDPGLKILSAAALSPDGSRIAVVGHCEGEPIKVLRLLSIDGALLASTVLTLGGTGSSTRWSRDSKLLGTVSKGEFRIYEAQGLGLYAIYPEEYPADLAFLSDGEEVALGSWSGGRIVKLPPRDA